MENSTTSVIDLYNNKVSANKISAMLNLNISSVMKILRKNDVNIRTISENVNYYYNESKDRNLIFNSEELDSLLKGNLIGDGNLRMGKVSVHYCHTDKHLEYLIWLKNKFLEGGIESSVYSNPAKNGCYAMQTRSYNFMEKYYNMFYKEKRIVPDDIKLNPIILRQWYISDGSISKTGGPSIAKSPCDDNLMDQLKSLFGDKCTYHLDKKTGWGKFYIPKKYKYDFLSYIGDCPIPCYEYKWRME